MIDIGDGIDLIGAGGSLQRRMWVERSRLVVRGTWNARKRAGSGNR